MDNSGQQMVQQNNVQNKELTQTVQNKQPKRKNKKKQAKQKMIPQEYSSNSMTFVH